MSMRRNPRLPKSSVIGDNAEDIARSIVTKLAGRMTERGLGPSAKISSLMGEGESFMVGEPISYQSSSGVSGVVLFYLSSDSMRDRNVKGGASSRTVDGGEFSRIRVYLNRGMRTKELATPEFNEELLKVIVHELGHVIDKNTRYSGGSRASKDSGGTDSYINSRVEIQAEAQAAYFALKRYAMASKSRIPARSLEQYVLDYAPYHLAKRYGRYTEPSKRIFLLYLYNSLNDEGLLS